MVEIWIPGASSWRTVSADDKCQKALTQTLSCCLQAPLQGPKSREGHGTPPPPIPPPPLEEERTRLRYVALTADWTSERPLGGTGETAASSPLWRYADVASVP